MNLTIDMFLNLKELILLKKKHWCLLLAFSVVAACGRNDEHAEEAPAEISEPKAIETPVEEAEKVSKNTSNIAPPKPLTATEATIRANQQFAESLPFHDKSDFKNARRGFIASIEDGVIKDDTGKVVWDQSAYAFLDGEAPATVNPSLWRHAQLNRIHGLFEITDGLYQVRGYDIAVMTVIRGDTGWILVDPLLSKETAAASLELVNRELGERPVVAVLLTHSHADHFGGIRGVMPSDPDVAAGVEIVAPHGFAEHAVGENIIAGNAMSRRAQFQFGNQLPPSPVGKVDSGIGKALSTGVIGFLPPTDIVHETGERRVIDGVEFVFIYAPDTEAPSEFMFYMPAFKAIHLAELATRTFHNVLTLRGAEVRDALAWSKSLNKVIELFGDSPEIALASHNWPTWGKKEVRQYLENQRDSYQYLHDQTLRLANRGHTMHEIAAQIGEPDFMKEDFSVRGYYGTMNHNSKATYQKYFGWWDGNPANLNPHPPEEEAKRFVNLAGGAENMIKNASKAYEEGDYRWVATIMNHLVFAEPENETARAFLASAYEQLGFQAESSIWRNYFLSAALELRRNDSGELTLQLANADFVHAVASSDYFDALATRVNPEKVGDEFRINFSFTDSNEKFGIQLVDGTAMRMDGHHLDDATISVSMERNDLDEITLGQSTFQEKLEDGSIVVDGDPTIFGAFLQVHDQPDPMFNVVEP